jgi:hypothetical protein
MLAVAAAAVALGSPLRADAFLSPARGELLAPGDVIEARWSVACTAERSDADEAELVLSLDGGNVFAIRVSRDLSTCQDRLRWTVPALPTRQARLALRRGSGGREETETVSMVSEPFVILPDPDGHVEVLHARRGESWVEPDAALAGADELLRRSICAGGRLSSEDPGVPEAEAGEDSGLQLPASRERTPRDSGSFTNRDGARPAEGSRQVLPTLRL